MLISSPESYGLSPDQTLAHVSDEPRVEGFESFWSLFRAEVDAVPPRFDGRIDGLVNPVEFRSIRGVRIAGRLTLPPESPRGLVVTSHGASAPDTFEDEPEPWTDRGLATLRIRVRGFPPSTADIDDRRADWLLAGIESPDGWIVRGAVADLVQACRCLRRQFGPELPLSLHGESLGAGLAVLAAAELTRRGEPPHRLALGLPSLGHWSWRLGRYVRGLGAMVNTAWEAWRDHRDALRRTLNLFDAAIHARDVTAPAFVKLATLDDVVPAPAAAAVANGLASARSWRFVTRYGHFDGGISDLRRHAEFERRHPVFLDPAVEPEKTPERFNGDLEC